MGRIVLPMISQADAQRLSRVFNAGVDLRMTQDHTINEWLKGLIAFAGRCPTCHGEGTANFEGAAGWDELCPTCSPEKPHDRSEREADAILALSQQAPAPTCNEGLQLEADPGAPTIEQSSRVGADDAIGAAEREVGRYIYRRIEALMDAKPGTPEGAELTFLAAIASSVEEYGEEACAADAGVAFPPVPADPES